VIVDCHMHVWPDHIADAMQAQRPAGMQLQFDGKLSGLLRTMDETGIDRGLALGVGIKASVVERTNEFIGSVPRDRLVPVGTVHPELSVETNLASLLDNGIRGVKLHPLFQTLDFRDPRVVDICTALADHDLPVIAHVGAGAGDEANRRGAPDALSALVDAVPALTVIACHFGGYHRLDEARQHVVGSRVILETSWPPALAELEREQVVELIRTHGADRVVYGSDWPMADPAAEIASIQGLGLEPAEVAAVLGGNLAGVFGL
jgi:predicted TIM-barrel fold metal-dependent hydrolase